MSYFYGGSGYGAGYGYGYGYGASAGGGFFGNTANSFTLLVVLFILLIIVGSNYPIAQEGPIQ